MNELEARRHLLADPRDLSPELRDTIARQPALDDFRGDLLDLDERVHAALTEPALPHGLADRMVLRARYGGAPRVRLALPAADPAGATMASLPFVLRFCEERATLG